MQEKLNLSLGTEFVEHLKAIEILTLAEKIVKDMSLRHQVNEIGEAVQLVDTVAEKLLPVYEKIKTGAVAAAPSTTFTYPEVDTLNKEECTVLKQDISRVISQLDKRISSEGQK